MRNKKVFSLVLALAVCATTIGAPVASEAASKPTLVKKLSLKAGQTKKITVKKATKKAKLTWKTSKKSVAKIKKSGKFACKVTGAKKGTATVTCTVKQGKKKYSLKCKVTVAAKDNATSATPSANPSEVPSATPASSAAASATPVATPIATPSFVTMAPPQKPTDNLPANIKNNYRGIFEHMGTCANFYGYGAKKDQLRNEDTIEFITDQFNSITLENEMKPDGILGNGANLISKEDAAKLGYVIPENYKEDKVPQLNFDATDGTLEFCAKYNMPLRGHTLMWHQQTPTWFFKDSFSNSGATVDPEVMDARLEFYVRTVMGHVLEKEKELTGSYGSIVYAWDVVNEYLHHDHDANKPSWADVYGEQGIESKYVKRAFELAYDVIKQYNVTDKVTLFYNDYDTYFEVDDVVALVTYINKDEEANICGGIGMQTHVDIARPTLDEYKHAMETFMNTGLEVQITELDVTINLDTIGYDGKEPTYSYKNEGETFEDQAAYVKDFMEMVISLQRNRNLVTSPKGITAITIWGLHDGCSWRRTCAPLLFEDDIDEPKPAYYAFINAAETYYK